jgi:N-acetylglutamate synthase
VERQYGRWNDVDGRSVDLYNRRMSELAPSLVYRPLSRDDLAGALALWRSSDGVGLSAADEPEALGRFLDHNEGLCWCATDGHEIRGTILCGCDGRRGYLYHVAVADALTMRGVGRRLVEHALCALEEAGIGKCHAMVFAANEAGRLFWERVGWSLRDDLVVFSHEV